jgi:hypothetical protein
MGIMSTLGKIAGNIGGSFIGDSQLGNQIFSAAGDAGSVMGAQQGGANNARMGQGQLNAQHDRNAIDLFQAQQQAQQQQALTDLQRKQFEQGSRGTNAKQAMIGALLGGGVTPTSLSGGHASGGLLQSLNANPEALAAMKMLGQQGSAAQSTPMAFQGGQMLTAPKLMDVPKIDTGNGVMGTMTKIAQLMGAVSPYLKSGEGE